MNIIIMRTVGPPQKAVGPGQPPRLPPPKSGTDLDSVHCMNYVSTLLAFSNNYLFPVYCVVTCLNFNIEYNINYMYA